MTQLRLCQNKQIFFSSRYFCPRFFLFLEGVSIATNFFEILAASSSYFIERDARRTKFRRKSDDSRRCLPTKACFKRALISPPRSSSSSSSLSLSNHPSLPSLFHSQRLFHSGKSGIIRSSLKVSRHALWAAASVHIESYGIVRYLLLNTRRGFLFPANFPPFFFFFLFFRKLFRD